MWQAMYLVIPEVTICKYPGFYVTLCIISSIEFENNWCTVRAIPKGIIHRQFNVGPTHIHTIHTCRHTHTYRA